MPLTVERPPTKAKVRGESGVMGVRGEGMDCASIVSPAPSCPWTFSSSWS